MVGLCRGVFCSQMGGQRCQVQGAVDVCQSNGLPCWQGILVSFWEANLPHPEWHGGQVVLMWLLRGIRVIRQ